MSADARPLLPRPRSRVGAWWRARRKRLLQMWSIGVGASLVVTALSAMGYLEVVRAKTLDLFIKLRGQQLASDVVIVAIDEEAFEALGQRQPLPRAYLVKLLHGLQRSGAAVVGLDIALLSATARAEDAALARAIADFSDDGLSRVVLAATTLPDAGPLADPRLWGSVVRGSPDIPQEDDGMVRRAAFLVPRSGGRWDPAFSLAVAARLGRMDQSALERALAAPGGIVLPRWRPGEGWTGGPPVATRPGELTRINFVGPARAFLTIPSRVVAALGEAGSEVAADNPFRGRIVLVGATFQESRDHFATPHGSLAGVEVHANLVHMLVTRSFIRRSGWLISLAVQIAVVLAGGVALVLFRPMAGTVVTIAGALLIGLPASYLAFQRGGYWVDFLLPILATRYLSFGADALERRRFRQAFGRYVSPEVAAQVLAEAPSLTGERREVSILFSDLRGFTTLAETMPPEQVAHHLNEYFEVMTAAIFRSRGMVNDFVGDAVMAIFGAPLGDREHALHAVQAARAMDEGLTALNDRWKSAGLPLLRMGIGIHTGEVFAGNVGGRKRLKYTIIGDAVNVASRVEGLNKELGTTILITETTRDALGDRVEARDCGPMPVKGRHQPVRVYEALALRTDEPGDSPREGAHS